LPATRRKGRNAIYVGGWKEQPPQFTGDAYLSKCDRYGSVLWTQTWGSPQHDEVHEIATDDYGGIFVVGCTEGSIDFQPYLGARDAFATKTRI